MTVPAARAAHIKSRSHDGSLMGVLRKDPARSRQSSGTDSDQRIGSIDRTGITIQA